LAPVVFRTSLSDIKYWKSTIPIPITNTKIGFIPEIRSNPKRAK
jgi:hypothetical protein